MKKRFDWMTIPTAIAMTMAIATSGYSTPVQTPLAAPISISGNSGGSQASQCGFIPTEPNQVIVVNQPSPLRITLQGQGQPTLWITGPSNRCVMADTAANGTIEVPGVWEQGTYSVFVGDMAQSGQPFTLSITQEN
ncbi:MAG: hypothetical protein KME11_19340 [Timaviella obliquedivisa GSE-PSE-MK23-08B]|jgi:hypothetical protein|nr:hypothetical protein [Timaviella obliquedivisa GSE-PSE-MK23-08B]